MLLKSSLESTKSSKNPFKKTTTLYWKKLLMLFQPWPSPSNLNSPNTTTISCHHWKPSSAPSQLTPHNKSKSVSTPLNAWVICYFLSKMKPSCSTKMLVPSWKAWSLFRTQSPKKMTNILPPFWSSMVKFVLAWKQTSNLIWAEFGIELLLLVTRKSKWSAKTFLKSWMKNSIKAKLPRLISIWKCSEDKKACS